MTVAGSDLEALFVRLEKPVYNVVYRWLWNREEARDVTQEAFMKIWSARARVDPATVEPLLFRAALNLAANRLRARKLWGWVTLDGVFEKAGAEVAADEALVSDERDRAVRAAIEALPPKLKDVVVLCELSGLSYAQIAQTLKIPIGTVGSRRSLAVAALEKALS